MSKKNRILDAQGQPVATQAPAPAQAPTIVPAYRLPNPEHSKFPQFIDYTRSFIRVTAPGTGDSIFLRTSEILAFEVNSETSRGQFVLKSGAVLPVIEDPEVILRRLTGED